MDGNDDEKKRGNRRPIRLTEDAAILNTFALVIRNKFSSTVESPTNGIPIHVNNNKDYDNDNDDEKMKRTQSRLDRLDQFAKSPAYKAEFDLMRTMNDNGLTKGLLAGAATFLYLRRGPRFFQRILHKRFQNKNSAGTAGSSSSSSNTGNVVGGYTFDNTSISRAATRSGGGRKPGLFFRTLKFGLDVSLSMVIAMYGSMYFTDRNKLLNDAATIPLVKGRSLISDELCDDFIHVYRHIPRKVWDKYTLPSSDSGSDIEKKQSVELVAISNFVKNCMRRKIVEKEIMEQNRNFDAGMTYHNHHAKEGEEGVVNLQQPQQQQHVEIPSPGVSPDIPVVIQWSDKSDELKVERGFGEDGDDDYFGFGNDSTSFEQEDSSGSSDQ